MRSIKCSLSKTVLVAGCLTASLASTNAALTWQEVPVPNLPPGTDFTSVWARNPQEVYVWGQVSTNTTPNAQLYRWNGAGWTNVLAVNGQWSHSVYGIGSAEVFVACDTNIWRSTDNGTTWALQSTPLAGGLVFRSIRGTPNNVHAIAYRVGNGENGYDVRFDGSNWTTVFNTPNYPPYVQTQVSATEGYFVGCWGWGLWNGASWSVVNQGFDFCDIYDTWALRDSGGGLHWWAVGNNNFGNGIRIWCFNTNTMSFGGKSAYCFSDGNGYLVGSAYGIWASGANDAYVIGGLATTSGGPQAGRVYHFDGTAWSRLTTVGDIVPSGIWGTSSNDVWIAGSGGRLVHGLVPPPQPDPLSYFDGFEEALNTNFWSTSLQSGSIVCPSSTRAHSGSHSVELVSTATGQDKQIHLYHQFQAKTYGTVSVWVYDTGANVSSANYITFRALGGGNVVGSIYTADYDLGPGQNGSTYLFGAAGRVPTDGVSALDRTQAWHKFTITILPSSVTLKVGDGVNDTVIYSGPGGQPFDRVEMSLSGPSWRPAWSAQFDDFSFVAASTLDIRLSQVELCWNSASNVTYQVEYKLDLGAANWLPLGLPVMGTGSRMCVTDAIVPGQPKRFYQVVGSNTP